MSDAEPDLRPLWQREPLRDKKGLPIVCGHAGCYRNAVRIIAWEAPTHREFRGRTHNCCSVHSKPRVVKEP